jgi:adenosylhomocysteinase
MDGINRIHWVSQFMPVLSQIKADFEKNKPLKGISIAMALHVEPKTAFLVKTLEAGGANVAITGCNPLSTQDDTVKALNDTGSTCYGRHGQSDKEYYEAINKVLDIKPNIVIDDGCDLIFTVHKTRTDVFDTITGGCEETTTGIHRLKAMQADGVLKFPVMNVNDSDCKHLFDNVYGTGESVLSSIMITTNAMISGKNFVVAGYGFCGSGLANKARGLGANVIVTEINPVLALKAKMDGFQVMPMINAVQKADFIVTTTGMKDILTKQHFEKMKNKCIMSNAGHFNVEINLSDLRNIGQEKDLDEDITQYELPNGKKFFVLAKGRLVNLATSKGLGHPMEVMDLSFALQALGTKHLVETNGLANVVHDIPKKIDDAIARLKLKATESETDLLSDEQKKYGSSWDVGT